MYGQSGCVGGEDVCVVVRATRIFPIHFIELLFDWNNVHYVNVTSVESLAFKIWYKFLR